ncbi:dienelactone hydrolase family protein [Marivirga arenosa]|uniref:Dienelactone hydrolase family protein n=1 Tax=Marivirga arenosa TaxID=3059076 RepID=A0AA51X3U2_9BACT|nr:dienelactone hydrolase family protein [Marivirga sp. BKB1-2]WNB16958.1 dienelactone hydrolase family protein [Marivirga sp. BKB1-2]
MKNSLKIPTLILLTFILSVHLIAQDKVENRLEVSPRHHEWVELAAGDKTLKSFIVYPQVSEPVKAVIIIHENRGLTDWVRNFADQLAAEGYIAFAPDMLSDFNEEFSQTSDFPSSDDARNAIYELDPKCVSSYLNVAFKYLKNLPAANGRVSVIGFCWGGSQSFRYATNNPDLKEALVFYGTGPKESIKYMNIQAPVYGFYGENDQRVNSTIDASKKAMDNYQHIFDYEIYEGAGHAYMRSGDDPDGPEANIMARNKSWERMLMILGQ